MNYLVSTFSDGEGRLKDVFVISAYSLMPFIILTLPMTLLSHILTFNEAPILSFYNNVILVYSSSLNIFIKGSQLYFLGNGKKHYLNSFWNFNYCFDGIIDLFLYWSSL